MHRLLRLLELLQEERVPSPPPPPPDHSSCQWWLRLGTWLAAASAHEEGRHACGACAVVGYCVLLSAVVCCCASSGALRAARHVNPCCPPRVTCVACRAKKRPRGRPYRVSRRYRRQGHNASAPRHGQSDGHRSAHAAHLSPTPLQHTAPLGAGCSLAAPSQAFNTFIEACSTNF